MVEVVDADRQLDKNDDTITQGEIEELERVKLELEDSNDGPVGNENTEFLRGLQEESLSIISGFVDQDFNTLENGEKEKLIRAIQTFLKTKVIGDPIHFEDPGDFKVDGNLDNLKRILGDNPEEKYELCSLLLGNLDISSTGTNPIGKDVSNLLTVLTNMGVVNDCNSEGYKSWKSNFLKKDVLSLGYSDLENAKPKIKAFLKELCSKNVVDGASWKGSYNAMLGDGGWLGADGFRACKLMMLDILGTDCVPDLVSDLDSNQDPKYSRIVEAFQKKCQGEKGIRESGGVDGKLGLGTFRVLMGILDSEDLKSPFDGVKLFDGVKFSFGKVNENDKHEVVSGVGVNLDQLRSFDQIKNLGTWQNGGEPPMTFKAEYLVQNGDSKYIKIGGEKYKINPEDNYEEYGIWISSESKIVRKYGNAYSSYDNLVKIGRYEDGVFIGRIISEFDGKSVVENRLDGGVRSKKMKGKFDDDGNYKGGEWNIGVVDFNNDFPFDAEKFSDELLAGLEMEQVKTMLLEAWKAYEETGVKPSKNGRYNLEHVIFLANTFTVDNEGGFQNPFGLKKFSDSWIHETVKTILGLKKGLNSDPAKKLKNPNEGEEGLTQGGRIQNVIRDILIDEFGVSKDDLPKKPI